MSTFVILQRPRASSKGLPKILSMSGKCVPKMKEMSPETVGFWVGDEVLANRVVRELKKEQGRFGLRIPRLFVISVDEVWQRYFADEVAADIRVGAGGRT